MTTERARPRHGQATKVLTAGISSSLVLGIVAAFAHAAHADEVARRRLEEEAVRSGVPVTTPAAPLPTVFVPVPGSPQPVVPNAPITVPVAVPAPAAVTPAPVSASTKASG
ncbi:MAG TPA: hypothetical protein VMS14_02410 [Ilumatobacteraceae bacterium]|nr:hypothetical protein [Ilumatobacteraceae bacterium]